MRSFTHITLIIHIYIAYPKVNIKRKLNGYVPGTTTEIRGNWRLHYSYDQSRSRERIK